MLKLTCKKILCTCHNNNQILFYSIYIYQIILRHDITPWSLGGFRYREPWYSTTEAVQLYRSWFRSYLTDRGQFVNFSGVSPPLWISPVGFHRASIRCPLLFLLYANDRVTAIDAHCKLFLFADNSILAVSGNKILVTVTSKK